MSTSHFKSLLGLLLLLLLSNLLVVGQNDFRKGKIIKTNNDSVVGLVKYKGDIKNALSCTFKNDSDLIEDFKPGEIKGYQFKSGKFYVSKYAKIGLKTTPLFAEYLVEGKKNLYFIRDKDGFHFFIDFRSDTIQEVFYETRSIYIDGVYYKEETTSHKNLLKSYFREAPSIFPQIDRLEKPDFHNMIKLTKDYHHIACSDSCIVYYKRSKRHIFSIEPQFGTANYSKLLDDSYGSNSMSQNGVMIYFWMPRANEKLYFKTGFSYSKFDIDNKSSLLKIPIQFEYLFLSHSIRPKLDVGFNYYHVNSPNGVGKGLTVACSGGVLFMVNELLAFDLSMSSDLLALAYGSALFTSYSIETGMRITF